MTREEAIQVLKRTIAYESDFAEAKQMAIEALKGGDAQMNEIKNPYYMQQTPSEDGREVHNCFEPISTPIYDYMVGKGGAE